MWTETVLNLFSFCPLFDKGIRYPERFYTVTWLFTVNLSYSIFQVKKENVDGMA